MAIKKRRNIDDLLKREVGDLSPRLFADRVTSSEDLILRLGIHKSLEGHEECVNSISFNADGNILMSSSNDRMVMLWDWDAGITELSFHSGHSNHVFKARFMPCTNDRTIVTCAGDGEVRRAIIGEGGSVATKMLARHDGRAYGMAVEPGSPHIFYCCGDDGLVQHFDLRSESVTSLFLCKSSYWNYTSLNAITIDPSNSTLFAVGGSDNYARVYDKRKYTLDGYSDYHQPVDCFCPPHLIGNNKISITGLAFSHQSELLASYHRESIYLFTRDQGLGSNPFTASSGPDAEEGSSLISAPVPQVYKGHNNNYSLKEVSFLGPKSEYVVSGSDCARVYVWRKKDGELMRRLEGGHGIKSCIETHPYDTTIASSGVESTIRIWTPNATEPLPYATITEHRGVSDKPWPTEPASLSPETLQTVLFSGAIEELDLSNSDFDSAEDEGDAYSDFDFYGGDVFDSGDDPSDGMMVHLWLPS